MVSPFTLWFAPPPKKKHTALCGHTYKRQTQKYQEVKMYIVLVNVSCKKNIRRYRYLLHCIYIKIFMWRPCIKIHRWRYSLIKQIILTTSTDISDMPKIFHPTTESLFPPALTSFKVARSQRTVRYAYNHLHWALPYSQKGSTHL